MHWLFNEGASSRLGEGADAATPDSMSLGSLQVGVCSVFAPAPNLKLC